MGSVDRTQALLLSHPDVIGAYIKDNKSDQFLPRIPKMAVRGDALQCTSVASLGGAMFISSGGMVDEDATTYDTPARKFELRRIASKVEVAGDIAQNVSMINDVFEQQIQAKMVATWNTVSTQLITGDDTEPNVAGLRSLANDFDYDGGVITGPITPLAGTNQPFALADLDRMIKLQRPWDGGQPRAFVMNSTQYANLAALAHGSGFELPYYPDPILQRPVMHYQGVCVLISDFILNDEGVNNTTSIYLVHLGPREGDAQFGGFIWFYNEDTGAGIRVDGPHRTSAQEDILYADLELNIGFASLSTNAVLRLQEVAQSASP